MSATIEVRVSSRPVQGGREAVVESKSDPLQKWTKWYAFEGEGGTELSLLGLTDDEPPVAQGYILSIRRKLKEEASVDPEELLRYGFRPF
jgi:hypothetical protein